MSTGTDSIVNLGAISLPAARTPEMVPFNVTALLDNEVLLSGTIYAWHEEHARSKARSMASANLGVRSVLIRSIVAL